MKCVAVLFVLSTVQDVYCEHAGQSSIGQICCGLRCACNDSNGDGLPWRTCVRYVGLIHGVGVYMIKVSYSDAMTERVSLNAKGWFKSLEFK